jgi:hypothetical protein
MIPSAPESGGRPMIFLIYDNGGANAAALLSTRNVRTVNGETYGEMDVHPTSDRMTNWGYTLSSSAAEPITGGSVPCQGVMVKASKNNAATIYVGDSAVTADEGYSNSGWPLDPGDAVAVPARDASDVHVRGTSGDIVAIIAAID